MSFQKEILPTYPTTSRIITVSVKETAAVFFKLLNDELLQQRDNIQNQDLYYSRFLLFLEQ